MTNDEARMTNDRLASSLIGHSDFVIAAPASIVIAGGSAAS
jgi:hypothetical protein